MWRRGRGQDSTRRYFRLPQSSEEQTELSWEESSEGKTRRCRGRFCSPTGATNPPEVSTHTLSFLPLLRSLISILYKFG